MHFFILIQLVQSEFRIESPDNLKDSQLTIQAALFGNPNFYSNYGKIEIVKECKISKLLEYETIVVLSNSTNCCILDMARSVRNSGGRGLIVVQDQANLIQKDCDGDDPNILVLSISKADFKKYIEKNDIVWITYRYMLFQSNYPFIEVKLTGNFSIDLRLTLEFLKLNTKFSILWDFIRIQIMTTSNSSNSLSDCILSSSNKSLCLPGTDSISGIDKLKAYSLIFSVYEKFFNPNSTAPFFTFLKSVFQNCDYNVTCMSEIAKYYIKTLKHDTSILDRYISYKSGYSRFIINSVDIYWFSHLESAFCLSFMDQPQECEFCSPGCSFKLLKSSNCSLFCDNIHCGFSNLRCQRDKGCFHFMLGDGNCNEMCIDDPDCNQDAEYLRFFLYSVIACCFVVFVV